jgi:hypothetical protein
MTTLSLIISIWRSAHYISSDGILKGTLATDAVGFRENRFIDGNHDVQRMLRCCIFG